MWGGVQRPIAGRNQSTTMPGGQPSAMPTSRRTTSFYPTIRPGNGSARTIFGGPSSPRGSCSPAARRSRGTRGGSGHPNGIAIQITNRTKTVKTETGRKRDVTVVERFTLTDDLGDVMERVIDAVEIVSA